MAFAEPRSHKIHIEARTDTQGALESRADDHVSWPGRERLTESSVPSPPLMSLVGKGTRVLPAEFLCVVLGTRAGVQWAWHLAEWQAGSASSLTEPAG